MPLRSLLMLTHRSGKNDGLNSIPPSPAVASSCSLLRTRCRWNFSLPSSALIPFVPIVGALLLPPIDLQRHTPLWHHKLVACPYRAFSLKIKHVNASWVMKACWINPTQSASLFFMGSTQCNLFSVPLTFGQAGRSDARACSPLHAPFRVPT